MFELQFFFTQYFDLRIFYEVYQLILIMSILMILKRNPSNHTKNGYDLKIVILYNVYNKYTKYMYSIHIIIQFINKLYSYKNLF